VLKYYFSAEVLMLLMLVAVAAGCAASMRSRGVWRLASLLALGTLFFIFSQIT
jgi:hypothetical protein